ncbi:hypothetical protein [Clostridium estertheticum]|uniref:hypothetical protein n=1 Tax=Clostridium estertheticum TaxID=238834 RepID=UPI001C0BDB9E|nr:hypothetical protein [Clostridium estertheticum]MBU3173269.1 hypothetical protein [Clostridium estertheticum]
MAITVNENLLSGESRIFLNNCKNKSKFIREAIEIYVKNMNGDNGITESNKINENVTKEIHDIKLMILQMTMGYKPIEEEFAKEILQKDKFVNKIKDEEKEAEKVSDEVVVNKEGLKESNLDQENEKKDISDNASNEIAINEEESKEVILESDTKVKEIPNCFL